jgi:hypothetical protein
LQFTASYRKLYNRGRCIWSLAVCTFYGNPRRAYIEPICFIVPRAEPIEPMCFIAPRAEPTKPMYFTAPYVEPMRFIVPRAEPMLYFARFRVYLVTDYL